MAEYTSNLNAEDTKGCRDCGATLPLSAFHRRAASRDGHRTVCKTCSAVSSQARYEYDPEVVWARQIKRLYGVTPEWYYATLEAQGGACDACKRQPKEGRRLHIDHHHGTGQVRGLLCNKCNTALAPLDDKEQYALLVAYLDKHEMDQ